MHATFNRGRATTIPQTHSDSQHNTTMVKVYSDARTLHLFVWIQNRFT